MCNTDTLVISFLAVENLFLLAKTLSKNLPSAIPFKHFVC
jgi:hypothetical protein